MNRYAAEVSYDGGKFFGWQIQPELPTVQQALEEAISKINGRHTPVAGAGRTDTGYTRRGRSAHLYGPQNGSRAACCSRPTRTCRRESAS